MQKKKMCPMMMGQQMPMMEMPTMEMPMMMQHPCMQMPMMQMPTMEMPTMMQHPCMQMSMMEPMNMNDMEADEDEKDEAHFAAMQGDTCRMMMIYVVKVIEKTELTINIYDTMPDQAMVDKMTGDAFAQMMKEHPEIADDKCAERAPFGSANLARDLLGVLLIGELVRRRRRRRRPYGGFAGGLPYGYGYGDYYYYD